MSLLMTYNGFTLTTNGVAWGVYDPYNPLDLPPYTMRIQFTDTSFDPSQHPWTHQATWTQVSANPNVWDMYYPTTDWTRALSSNTSLASGNYIDVLGANTTGVTFFASLFYGMPVRSVPLFDTSAAISVTNMFYYTNVVTIPQYDTSNCTDFRYMFSNCYSLKSVPSLDTHNATRVAGMFFECEELESVGALDFRNVTNMVEVFSSCMKLENITLLNATNITSLERTFGGCNALQALPTMDVSHVQSISGMCSGCTSLTHLPSMNFSTYLTNTTGAFGGCYSVSSGILDMYNTLSGLSSVTAHSDTFIYCGSHTVTGAAELAQIPTSWGGTMV